MYLHGAGGHAKVIVEILKSVGQKVEGLVDTDSEIKDLNGIPVYHGETDFSPVIVSIGNNATRKKVAEKLNCEFGTAVDASAIVSDSAKIGEGTVVMQGAIIQVEAEIGRHCIVNTGASVDHECRIGDYVHISPHATLCGDVTVGEGAWIGAGATVIQGVKIGKWSVIGAGSVVVEDIPDNVMAFGNPCKVKKSL